MTNELMPEDHTYINNKDSALPVYEAILLAGGYGLRLRDVVPDLPKVMAPVAGKPFLSHVIDSLRLQGISRFVFSLGYKADVIEHYLKEHYPTLDYVTVTEQEPLGTGGAVRLALQKIKGKNVVIANGDTMFKVNIDRLLQTHERNHAECTLAVKPVKNADRYGKVLLGEEGNILAFNNDETNGEDVFINGGVYLLNRERFFNRSFPQKFSFERDYLAACCKDGSFFGSIQNSYFIDIGVPEAYAQAQKDLAPAELALRQIDKTWTLFIDRDGVINEETIGEYVLHWDQFIFSRGVLQSFKKLSDVFGKLILVTNQRGVGKGLMTREALDTIHYEMQREVAIAGGHIDKILFCTDVDNTSFNRKPNPGMAVLAKQAYPDIDFSKSIMVGNKPSDMRFGRAAGMFTVFLATTNPDHPFPHPDIDLRYSSLADFAAALP